MRGLARPVVGQIRPVGVRVAVHDHDVDPLGRVAVGQRRVRAPVDARDLLAVELNLLEQGSADSVQEVPLDRVLEAVGVDDEAAVVRADHALHPHAPALPVDLDLGDRGDRRLYAVRVRDAASGEDASGARSTGRGPRVPAIRLGRRLDDGDGARPPEGRVILGRPAQEAEAKLDRVRVRGRGHLIDERLAGEGRLRPVGVAQVPRAERRLEGEREADGPRLVAPVRDVVHLVRAAAAPG